MFFLMLLLSFGAIGSIICMIDTILPGFFIYPVDIFVRWTGIILLWCGVMVYVGRQLSTGGGLFGNLANPSRTICLHVGKSNGKWLNARKAEPNRLKAKGVRHKGNMNIKDMGESINVAGHDVVITTQDDGHTIPLWICDLVDKWKRRYKIRDEKELEDLHGQIKNIESYKDLDKIPFLEEVMSDPEGRRRILDLSIDELREMRELLFDGRVVNVKSYLGWAEGATPYDNESLIESEVAHHRAQDSSLRYMGGVDWGKIVIPMVILLIMGAIAYQIFAGA